MRRSLLAIFFVLSAVVAYCAPTAVDGANLRVVNHGWWGGGTQSWPNMLTRFSRLPLSLGGFTGEAVDIWSTTSTGVALRFATNSVSLGVEYKLDINNATRYQASAATKGLDLYVRENGSWQYAATYVPMDNKQQSGWFTLSTDGKMHEYMLYLPLYDAIGNINILIDDDADLTVGNASYPDRTRRVVGYGAAAFQGGGVSRPGMLPSNIISRRLECEFINMGIAGRNYLRPEEAEALVDIQNVAAYVLDPVATSPLEFIEARAEDFITTLLDYHPEAVVLMLEGRVPPGKITSSNAFLLEKRNNGWRKVYEALIDRYPENLVYVKQSTIYGDDCELSSDGTLLSDYGAMRYASAVAEVLEPLIGTPVPWTPKAPRLLRPDGGGYVLGSQRLASEVDAGASGYTIEVSADCMFPPEFTWEDSAVDPFTGLSSLTLQNIAIAGDSLSGAPTYYARTRTDYIAADGSRASSQWSDIVPFRYVPPFAGGTAWNAAVAEAGVEPTYTLPVLHINTDNFAAINQRETYIPGTYYLEASHIEGGEDIGSAEAPLALEIRGRGNASWSNRDKKPYKLKLGKKASLCGMPKNKHFALLHYVGGYPTYFSHKLGMDIAREVLNCWTPDMTPVEVVLNHQYIGIYFLSETVRIDDNRLNIAEQPVGNNDAASADFGYLVEIDNYTEENQVHVDDCDKLNFRVTLKSPDPMTAVQSDYVASQFSQIAALLSNGDVIDRRWEDLLDLDDFARYFVVSEIMNNSDEFIGSGYLYKNSADDRWHFGPMWDIGDAFGNEKTSFAYADMHRPLITHAVKFPRFIKRVQEVYRDFRAHDLEPYNTALEEWHSAITAAEDRNQSVWNYYGKNSLGDRLNYTKNRLLRSLAWLDHQWNEDNLTRHVHCNVIDISTGESTSGATLLLGGHDYADGVDVFAGDSLAVAVVAEDMAVRALMVDNIDRTAELNDTGELMARNIDSDIDVILYVSGTSDLDDIDAGEFKLVARIDDDGILHASEAVTVSNTSGAVVGSGTRVELPARGVYLATRGSRTLKLVWL